MSQVTIYVPEDEARAIRQAARQAKRSVSDWAREQMAAQLKQAWPRGYFDLFGALQDESLQRPPQPPSTEDVHRKAV